MGLLHDALNWYRAQWQAPETCKHKKATTPVVAHCEGLFTSDSSVARRHRVNGRYFAGAIAAIPIQEWAFRGGDAECNRLSRTSLFCDGWKHDTPPDHWQSPYKIVLVNRSWVRHDAEDSSCK
jgi:hypothetical protein